MDLVSQALVALRWNAIVRLAGQLIAWTATVYVMRLLSPGDYGLLAMTGVFLEFLLLIADLGIGAAVVQTPALDERMLRQASGVTLAMNIAVGLAVFAGAPLIAQFYKEPRLVPIIQVSCLQFPLNALVMLPRALLQRKLAFKALSLVLLASTVACVLLTVAMAMAGAGVWALVAGNLVNVLLQAIVLNAVHPIRQWPLFSLDAVRGMVAFGAHVTGVGMLWIFWSQADALVAGRLLGRELLGAYAIANQIASMPLSRFSQIVSQVAFSAFSRLQDDPEAVRRSLLRSLAVLAMGAFPVFWGISCTAPELVAVAVGPRWAAAVLPLGILALVLPFRLLQQFLSVTVRSSGRADVDFRNTLAAAIVMPAAFYAGCRWQGLEGLSAAWITAYPCVLLWNTRNLLGAMGLHPSSLLRVITAPALAAAAMYGATALLRWWVRPWLGELPRAGLLVVCGAAVYSSLVWMLDRSTVLAAIDMCRSFAGTKRQNRAASR